MRYHVMADIETFGTGNNACPVVIGAVKFTQTEILDKFEVGIDPDDAQRYGRVITGGTVMYWLDPKRDDARRRLFEMPKVDLHSALRGFADWCEIPVAKGVPSEEMLFPSDDVLEMGSLWGKGSTFDNVILRSAAEACRVDWPFDFRQDECFRTMERRFPDIEHTFVGTPHVAVDDALNQALKLQKIAAAHGIVL